MAGLGGTGATGGERDGMTRAELLALTPDAVLDAGLQGAGPGGIAPLLAGEGALAMAEQLRAAEVPQEALDLCIVAFDRATDRSRPYAIVEQRARDELTRALDVHTAGHPSLARWVARVAARVHLREDLEAAIAFLMKVREVRALSEALGGD